MPFELRSETDAARFVSTAFAEPALLDIVKDLLLIASGQQPNQRRHLSLPHLHQLARHRVFSLVPRDWTVDVADGELMVMMAQMTANRTRLNLVMDSVLSAFAAEAIDCRVLKGLATSVLDYKSPDLRQSGDVDLFVKATEAHRARSVLHDLGCVDYAGLHYDPEIEKGLTLVHPKRVEIDVHTRMFQHQRQDMDLLLANPEPLPSSNGFALPVELRLIHAASHLVYTPPGFRRLSGLADITAITDNNDIDWKTVRHLAGKLGIESMTGVGLKVEAVLSGRDFTHLESWEQPSKLERLSFAREERAMLMERVVLFAGLQGIGRKARYVWSAILPTAEDIELRGGHLAYYAKVLPRRFGGQGSKRIAP